MRRTAILATLAVLAALATAAVLIASSGGNGTSETGARPSARAPLRSPSPPKLAGSTAPASPVDFSLVLRLPGQARLTQFLAQISDPHSPLYGHYIDARTFGRRYGLSRQALASVRAQLGRYGVTILHGYPQRTQLEVRASAQLVDRLFGVRLQDFRDRHGRLYHAPLGIARVPASLQPLVSGVAGLDTRPLLHRSVLPGVVGGMLTPTGARQAYDINPLFHAGIQGQGERIGTVSFGDLFTPSDVQSFDQQYGLPQTLPQVVPVNESSPCCNDSSNSLGVGEADLDAELTHATAPQAQVFAINTPPGPNGNQLQLGGTLNSIAGQHLVDIVSVSYGICEQSQNSGDLQSDNSALQSAVATGIMVFVSTGDAGAYACQQNIAPTDHRLSVQYPSTSPFVVAVGGTALAVGQDGSYAGENAWEDTLSHGGGGGGLSTVFPRPSWQTGVPGVQNQFSNGMRQVPDVSADADGLNSPWSNFGPVPTPNGAQSALAGAGGTSASTPFWAGVMALIRQYAQQQGHGRLGPVPPLLYQVAGTAFPNAPFHDISTGTNRYYPATPGWDFATGLGSPDVFNLAQDIVSFQKQNGH